jgi:hypothetical protein
MWSEVWRGSAAVKKKLVGELRFEVRDQTKARNRTRKFLEPKVSKHFPFPFAVVSHCTYPSLLLLRFPPSNHEADCQQNKLPSLQASFFLFNLSKPLFSFRENYCLLIAEELMDGTKKIQRTRDSTLVL